MIHLVIKNCIQWGRGRQAGCNFVSDMTFVMYNYTFGFPQVATEPDEVKQRDLWITDFVPMQNIYKLVLAMTSKEIGNWNKLR